MGEIQTILDEYLQPVSLEEINSVSLQNRFDTKFVFHQDRLPAILRQLSEFYRVLEVEGKRLITYRNIYYDTVNFQFYISHHNGKLNRFKVRQRKYVENDLSFFEIKFKNNKGRTIKRRIRTVNYSEKIGEKGEQLLHRYTHFESDELLPVIGITFLRITLVHKDLLDRLTLDFNLNCKVNGNHHIFDGIVIAELKQERQGQGSPFLMTMKHNGIREMRVSKYCLGMAHFYKKLKHNRFKERFLRINKIIYGRSA